MPDASPVAASRPTTRLALQKLTAKRPLPEPPVDPIADYDELAVSLDWGRLFGQLSQRPAPAEILDVGCGTGRFLRVLNRVWPELGSTGYHARYSAVDPVPGVGEVARNEASEFAVPGDVYRTSFQEFRVSPGQRFDVIWALHSLYSLHPSEVVSVVAKMASLLQPGGVAIIALSDVASFYAEAKPRLTGDGRYALADDVLAAVEVLSLPHEVLTLDYEEVIAASDEAALKNYLWHESIGNTWVPEGGSGGNGSPELPNDQWWEGFRRGDHFAFHQVVPVVQFWSS